MPVPPLLMSFAAWLEAVPHGSLGYFDALASEPLAEAFPDPRLTPALSDRIAMFLALPDGSKLALWDCGGEPAVVLLGSEGELRQVAGSLAAFLVALSTAATGVSDLDDNADTPQRRELAAWLAATGVAVPAPAPAPDFEDWYEALLDGREPPGPPRPRVVPSVPFAMDRFTATLTGVLGRPVGDAALREFLEALGHWPLPRFKSDESTLYVEDKPRGFCLLVRKAAQAAVLDGCFCYAEGVDDYRAFAGALPLGITWSDSAASLVTRLGEPMHEIKNKKTGKLSSQFWRLTDTCEVSAVYVGGGERLKHVYVAFRPPAS